MLLVIDAGNTNIVCAVFDGDTVKAHVRLASEVERSAQDYETAIAPLLEGNHITCSDIEEVVIATVVPEGLPALKSFTESYIGKTPLVVGENITVDMPILLDQPEEVGADRLVNALAAYHLYESALIVIDFGTATTFDVVSDKGEYMGGLIAPGINLSLEALHNAAAKLPSVDITKPNQVIGRSTIAAMQSGIYFGYIGLIEGIVTRIKEEYGTTMKTLATGGLAPLFFDATESIEQLEPELTIQGLYQLFCQYKDTE